MNRAERLSQPLAFPQHVQDAAVEVVDAAVLLGVVGGQREDAEPHRR